MENQSSETKLLEELDTLIRARYTLIAVNTYEEARLKECLIELAGWEKHREKPFYFWSRTNGLIKVVEEMKGGVPMKEPRVIPDTEDPFSVLEFIASQKTGIFLLCDFSPFVAPYGQEDAVLVSNSRFGNYDREISDFDNFLKLNLSFWSSNVFKMTKKS